MQVAADRGLQPTTRKVVTIVTSRVGMQVAADRGLQPDLF